MNEQPDGGLAEELLVEARRTLGRRLRRLRIQRDLSQDDVARHALVSQPTWSRVEEGVGDPRVSELLRVQHLFGLESLEALFGPSPTQRLLSEWAGPGGEEHHG
jgi:transcriptional regulator with XRE-family HTH domain